MLELEREKRENLRRARQLINELMELKEKLELNEINAGDFSDMATGKAKKLNAFLDYYNQGRGVYWD